MTTIDATEAQRRFGQLLDRACGGETVVVECHGHPRVVILDIERYRRLVQSEQALLRSRLQAASAEVSARAAHLSDAEIDALIKEARAEADVESGWR